MSESKKVTWRNLHPGDKITGWVVGNSSHMANATVVSTNPACVTLSVFDKYEKTVDSETAFFNIELSEDEYRTKYAAAAAAIIRDIQTPLSEYEIGYHELWNAWLTYDAFEMAVCCREQNMKIVGHCRKIIPKTTLLAGVVLDVGICCETPEGERFWCHASFSDMMNMVIRYQRENMVKNAAGTEEGGHELLIELPLVPFDRVRVTPHVAGQGNRYWSVDVRCPPSGGETRWEWMETTVHASPEQAEDAAATLRRYSPPK